MVTEEPGAGRLSDPYRQFNVTGIYHAGTRKPGPGIGPQFPVSAAINSWDISLAKECGSRRRARFEVRLDTFNTLNHTQFDGINSTLKSPA